MQSGFPKLISIPQQRRIICPGQLLLKLYDVLHLVVFVVQIKRDAKLNSNN